MQSRSFNKSQKFELIEKYNVLLKDFVILHFSHFYRMGLLNGLKKLWVLCFKLVTKKNPNIFKTSLHEARFIPKQVRSNQFSVLWL